LLISPLQRATFRPAPAEHHGPKTTDAVLRMRLVGANAGAKVTGLEELAGKSNYFIGNDPKKWRTNLPNYARVRYANVYPGVDLVYYGNQRELEYDFVVQPGADPRQIALDLRADGVSPPEGERRSSLHIDPSGDLAVSTDGGAVVFYKPVVYQPATDDAALTNDAGHGSRSRHFVDGKYMLSGNRVTFEVAGYDKRRSLIIDPALAYSTYLGGSGSDVVDGIAVDASGNVYVTGFAGSTDFPTIVGAFQTTFGGGVADVFISKLNSAGSALVYSTFVGGSAFDQGTGIVIDASGNAYVVGGTFSNDFPTTPGAFQTTSRGGDKAFVSKLNRSGSALSYSTYLGGSTSDAGFGIALDASGNAYVTGFTFSNDFPTTPGGVSDHSARHRECIREQAEPHRFGPVLFHLLGRNWQRGGL
jgi:hypothetical protein